MSNVLIYIAKITPEPKMKTDFSTDWSDIWIYSKNQAEKNISLNNKVKNILLIKW